MIGIVIVTHGRLAHEFRAALEHVVGPQEQLETISIGPDDDLDERRADMLAALTRVDNGNGVVVLTDMFGGTPSNLDMGPLHGGDGEIGWRAAEHVSEHHNAVAVVNARERGKHVCAPLIEIVVGTYGDGLELLLGSNHVLERSAELMRKPAVGNDDDADHIAPLDWSARLKAAIFVAPATRRKPEPMPVDEAIVTPLKRAPVSA